MQRAMGEGKGEGGPMTVSWILSRVLSPSHPDVLALREAKQVALRSARVPLGATPRVSQQPPARRRRKRAGYSYWRLSATERRAARRAGQYPASKVASSPSAIASSRTSGAG